ncbi:hypothetical protein ACHAWT_005332 [Skeletonema menzelii]
MSSLAATQADGYHIPEEYYTSGAYKKKSISQFNGSKGHNQYLQRSVVRFELPFDGFCTQCDAIVGKGTRFNAHKAHVDDYFSSKIYEFTTKCRSCADCEFRIRTNPKERTFDYVVGIRKKIEEFNSVEAGTKGVIDTDFGPGIFEYSNGKIDAPSIDNPESLHLLEKNARGHRKTLTEHEQMRSLLQLNTKLETDADANAALRSTFRKDRKAKKRRLVDAASAGLGRGIEMADETDDDVFTAKRLMQKTAHDKQAHQLERDNFNGLRASGIFGSKAVKGTKRLDVKRYETGQNSHKKRSEAKKLLESKPYRIKKKATDAATAAVKPTTAEIFNASSVSALDALAAYGSESDSAGD